MRRAVLLTVLAVGGGLLIVGLCAWEAYDWMREDHRRVAP